MDWISSNVLQSKTLEGEPVEASFKGIIRI